MKLSIPIKPFFCAGLPFWLFINFKQYAGCIATNRQPRGLEVILLEVAAETLFYKLIQASFVGRGWQIFTSNAASALMYPIAAAAGDQLGVDPKLISVSIMLGASSAFMSPFGFLTNLMVYGAGGYKTMDFVKYGAGLKERICTVTTALTALHSPCD
eukprot:1154462-Pelagomonas_calceolata.AAC.3